MNTGTAWRLRLSTSAAAARRGDRARSGSRVVAVAASPPPPPAGALGRRAGQQRSRDARTHARPHSSSDDIARAGPGVREHLVAPDPRRRITLPPTPPPPQRARGAAHAAPTAPCPRLRSSRCREAPLAEPWALHAAPCERTTWPMVHDRPLALAAMAPHAHTRLNDDDVARRGKQRRPHPQCPRQPNYKHSEQCVCGSVSGHEMAATMPPGQGPAP